MIAVNISHAEAGSYRLLVLADTNNRSAVVCVQGKLQLRRRRSWKMLCYQSEILKHTIKKGRNHSQT